MLCRLAVSLCGSVMISSEELSRSTRKPDKLLARFITHIQDKTLKNIQKITFFSSFNSREKIVLLWNPSYFTSSTFPKLIFFTRFSWPHPPPGLFSSSLFNNFFKWIPSKCGKKRFSITVGAINITKLSEKVPELKFKYLLSETW